MRIKVNTDREMNTRVYKDGVDITYRCCEVEEDGSMAILYALNDKGHFFLDDLGVEVVKEIVYDVTVLEEGE